MWLLIKVDNINDIGKNEQERYFINDSQLKIKTFGGFPDTNITATGIKVHPNTLDIEAVTPEKMKAYLLKKNWVEQPFGRPEILKFTSPCPIHNTRYIDVLMPAITDLIDYRRGVEVTLNTISRYEKRSTYDVYLEMIS